MKPKNPYDFSHLSDEELLSGLTELVKEERKLATEAKACRTKLQKRGVRLPPKMAEELDDLVALAEPSESKGDETKGSEVIDSGPNHEIVRLPDGRCHFTLMVDKRLKDRLEGALAHLQRDNPAAEMGDVMEKAFDALLAELRTLN